MKNTRKTFEYRDMAWSLGRPERTEQEIFGEVEVALDLRLHQYFINNLKMSIELSLKMSRFLSIICSF